MTNNDDLGPVQDRDRAEKMAAYQHQIAGASGAGIGYFGSGMAGLPSADDLKRNLMKIEEREAQQLRAVALEAAIRVSESHNSADEIVATAATFANFLSGKHAD